MPRLSSCWHLPGSRFPYSVSSQADLPEELLGDVENAHKVLASGKDLEAIETDLDIAQVRAGVRAGTCGLWRKGRWLKGCVGG